MRPASQVTTVGTSVPDAAVAGVRTLPNPMTVRANRIYRATGSQIFLPTAGGSYAELTLEDPAGNVYLHQELGGTYSEASDDQHGIGTRILLTAETVLTAFIRNARAANVQCAGLIHVEEEI